MAKVSEILTSRVFLPVETITVWRFQDRASLNLTITKNGFIFISQNYEILSQMCDVEYFTLPRNWIINRFCRRYKIYFTINL